MSWLTSIAIAILTAIVSAFASGFAANLAVSWYRIPSREGNSGFFVLFLGLAGLIGGFVLGLIVSRLTVAWSGGGGAGFVRGLGCTLGSVLAVVAIIAGI